MSDKDNEEIMGSFPDCFGTGIYAKAAIFPPPPDITCLRCNGSGRISLPSEKIVEAIPTLGVPGGDKQWSADTLHLEGGPKDWLVKRTDGSGGIAYDLDQKTAEYIAALHNANISSAKKIDTINIPFNLCSEKLPNRYYNPYGFEWKDGDWYSEWCLCITREGRVEVTRLRLREETKKSIDAGGSPNVVWYASGSWVEFYVWAYITDINSYIQPKR